MQGLTPCDDGVIRSGKAEAPGRGSEPWVLAATILGSSMAFLDGTAVNVALPALQAQLGATVSEVQWVVEAYALFVSSLLLVGGALGDRFGRRRIFLLGVASLSAMGLIRPLAIHDPDVLRDGRSELTERIRPSARRTKASRRGASRSGDTTVTFSMRTGSA